MVMTETIFFSDVIGSYFNHFVAVFAGGNSWLHIFFAGRCRFCSFADGAFRCGFFAAVVFLADESVVLLVAIQFSLV